MPYSGTLRTHVFTSRGQLPVPAAFVAVVQHTADGDQLLAAQTSDSSGNTPPVLLPTPDPADSLRPGDRAPFALCDIWAEHPGFQLMVVRDVQIFPGVVSIQELPLLPLLPGSDQTDVVVIPPQPL